MRSALLKAFLILTFLLSLACVSGAQSTESDRDTNLRCLAIGIELAGSSDEQQRNSGTVMSLYYLGRVDASNAKIDLSARIKSELVVLSPRSLRTNEITCGATLAARGAVLKAVGDHLRETTATK